MYEQVGDGGTTLEGSRKSPNELLGASMGVMGWLLVATFAGFPLLIVITAVYPAVPTWGITLLPLILSMALIWRVIPGQISAGRRGPAMAVAMLTAVLIGMMVWVAILDALSGSSGLIVLGAFAAAALSMLAAAIVAKVTKFDFSRIGTYLMVALVGLILVGLSAWVIPAALNEMYGATVYNILGVVVFFGFAMIDFQRVIRRGQAQGLTLWNDPIMVGIGLYLDFINLFLFFLRIFQGRRK